MPPAATSTTSRPSPPGAAERKAMAAGTMDILTAMRDPAVSGPHFKGDTWRPWQEFLSGLFGLDMSPEQLDRIILQGWRAWRKPLIRHRIWLNDQNPADFGAHAR